MLCSKSEFALVSCPGIRDRSSDHPTLSSVRAVVTDSGFSVGGVGNAPAKS